MAYGPLAVLAYGAEQARPSLEWNGIGDDTKAAARRSPNCIRKTKENTAKKDFQFGGWNSSFCDFDQISVFLVLFWIKFPNFVQIGPPGGSDDVIYNFKMAVSAATYYFRFRI